MLFKNVFRTLKKQYKELILLGVIITLSSFVYSLFDYSINSIIGPTEEYFEEANQEDFAVEMFDFLLEDELEYVTSTCTLNNGIPYTLSQLKLDNRNCYYDVHRNREAQLEFEYDFNIELREYKDLYFSMGENTYKYRVLKETDEINKSFYVEGRAPIDDYEIAISEAHGKANGFEVGDIITINEKEYVVSGYVLFSDYSIAVFGSSITFDNESQSVVTMTDYEFEDLMENVNFSYAGDYSETVTDEIFKSDVLESYRNNSDFDYISTIVLTKNNVRSGAIYGDIEGGEAMGLMLSLVIASIALLIVSIMVSKVLNSQRGPIGILKSLGYTNYKITMPYIFFIAILSLPTIFLGYYLGFVASTPMKDLWLSVYLLPSTSITFQFSTFIESVLLPFAFLVLVSFVIIRGMLNKKPVELLNPAVGASGNFITKRISVILKKFQITTKLKHLLLYRNIVKFIVFLIGMFYASFLILLSLSMYGIFDRILYDYYENTEYNYVGYCDFTDPCDEGNGEKVIEVPSVQFDDFEAAAIGLESNSEMHSLFDRSGLDITHELEDGAIVSRSLVLTKGVEVGDILTMKIGTKTQDVEILGISHEYSGNKVYLKRSTLGSFLGQGGNYFNVVYSAEPLVEENYMLVTNNEDILNQVNKMQGFFNAMVYILIFVSSAIGAIIIYILTILTIEDNFYNISLFKVIGYNEKEINKMVLGGYRLYGFIIFILSIPIAIVAFYLMTTTLAEYYNMIMPFEFKLWHGLVSVILFLTIFTVGAALANRKLAKVSLQEAMKMYQV